MSLFVCEKCKCVENTALGKYWAEKEKLCSECAFGKWHDKFPKEKFNEEKWEIIESGGYFVQEKEH